MNGVVSTNAEWARNNYNTQNIDGGRAAFKQIFTDQWSAVLTAGYQSQRHVGAWDQDPKYGDRKVSRFAPENGSEYVKSLDLHVDGDVGIADLVFASTYQQQATHQVNKYSEYVQYLTVAGFLPQKIQAYACLTDPIHSPSGVFSGCNDPAQQYVYDNNTQRWSTELRLQSKPGGRLQWLTGLYWEKTKDNYSLFYAMPGLQPNGDAYKNIVSYYNTYYNNGVPATPLPNEWYSYKSRFDYLDTTGFADLTFNLTDRWSFEAGVQHFKSSFVSSSQYAGYFWNAKVPSIDNGRSHKVNVKAGVNFKASKNLLLYGIFSQGFRDGGVNAGLGASCHNHGASQTYSPDNIEQFRGGLEVDPAGRAHDVERRVLSHELEGLSGPRIRSRHLSKRLQRQPRQCAHLRGGIECRLQDYRGTDRASVRQLQRLASRHQHILQLGFFGGSGRTPAVRAVL